MTQLFEINVKLSENQKKNIGDAYRKRETIVIRLTNDSLCGNDTLHVPVTVKNRLEKNRKENKGMDIKLSKTNIRKQVGGSFTDFHFIPWPSIRTNHCKNYGIGSFSRSCKHRRKPNCQENSWKRSTERRFLYTTE